MSGMLLCLALLYAVIATASTAAVPQTLQDEDKAYWMKSGQDTLKNALKMTLNKGVAKNVILFLGDGLSVGTATAARIYKGQKEGRPGEETQLNFEKFPHVALSKTYNTDRQTADSAGTATAFLCGVKGNYGTLGVDNRVARMNCTLINNTDTHASSIADWAMDAGKSAGIVTTTRVTHATPGAAYAHTPNRDWEKDWDIPDSCPGLKDVAYQLLNNASNFKVILGGGRREFYDRKDTRSLPEEWAASKRKAGMTVEYVQSGTKFREVDVAKTDYLLGVFSESHMAYEVSRNHSAEPSLHEMTKTAIEILQKNKDGFFLLVEGGRIDHAHHDNYAKIALEETIMFDSAIQQAVDMTGDDTLIVVTADHSHVFNIAGYPSRGNDILGLVDLYDRYPVDNLPYATLAYANGPGPGREQNLTGMNMSVDYFRSQRLVPFSGEMTETHSGEDVAIYAMGPMSHLFHGVHEQNYIAHVMGYAACIGPNKDHCKGGTSGADRKSCSLLTVAVFAAAAVRFVLVDWASVRVIV